ncbi:hypothetical protein QQ045_025174 [Rhodiola kirilowii]
MANQPVPRAAVLAALTTQMAAMSTQLAERSLRTRLAEEDPEEEIELKKKDIIVAEEALEPERQWHCPAGLTQEEINEPGRQWHCPACQRGPGAIDWFRGLQPLMTHAKTKGSKRVKLHREFADLLNEELARRGTSTYPSGEAFGKWKGLTQKTTDYAIVWPPIMVVMNT